jgi:acylphosphatase
MDEYDLDAQDLWTEIVQFAEVEIPEGCRQIASLASKYNIKGYVYPISSSQIKLVVTGLFQNIQNFIELAKKKFEENPFGQISSPTLRRFDQFQVLYRRQVLDLKQKMREEGKVEQISKEWDDSTAVNSMYKIWYQSADITKLEQVSRIADKHKITGYAFPVNDDEVKILVNIEGKTSTIPNNVQLFEQDLDTIFLPSTKIVSNKPTKFLFQKFVTTSRAESKWLKRYGITSQEE